MSSGTQMFINSPLTINQNTNIHATFLPEGTYDYIFCINISSISPDITGIFENASFRQNIINIESFDVNLTINPSITFENWESYFNNKNLVTINIGNSNVAFATLLPNINQTIGDRLLEVVAHKLFGHGQAGAAISNDYEFYQHDAEIWDHLSNAVSINNFRNDIFKQYFTANKYLSHYTQTNEINGIFDNNENNLSNAYDWFNFNFNGLTFDFPLYLSGSMILDSSLSENEISILQNGPNVGGTSLVNSQYNIPILVRFHQ
jgi:hypothetical protein